MSILLRIEQDYNKNVLKILKRASRQARKRLKAHSNFAVFTAIYYDECYRWSGWSSKLF